MTALFTLPKCIATPGAKLTFTQTGTTTAQNVYTDEALSVPHANPVVADASGIFAPIYLDPRLPSYRVKLSTSANVTVYQQDGIPSNFGAVTALRVESSDPNILLYDTDGTSGSRKYRIRAAGNTFKIEASNDAESSFTDVLAFSAGVLTIGGPAAAAVIDGNGVATNAAPSSFTGTLTGMTGTVSALISYATTARIAVIHVDNGLTGTSNSTSMTMTGLPTALQPLGDRSAICGKLCDAGNNNMIGEANISSTGVITFGIAKTNGVSNFAQSSTSGFTNSGTKGLNAGFTLTYPLI